MPDVDNTAPTTIRSTQSRLLEAALFGVPVIVLLTIYWPTLVFLVSQWEKQEEYSYCYLIPPVVAWLIWRLRPELGSVAARPSWQGLWPLVIGSILFWLGSFIGVFYLLEISLWMVAVGMLWLGLGWPRLKIMAFPLLFCLTMFPPPKFLVTAVTQHLQLFSSRLGVFLIQGVGLPAYREGNLIDLGFIQLQVIEACSGLNSIISLGVLGLLFAYLYRAVLWKKLVIVFSTVPLAIGTNGLRISLTGLIARHFGGDFAQGFFHNFSGWLLFILELPILYLEMRLLDKLPDRAATKPPPSTDNVSYDRQYPQGGFVRTGIGNGYAAGLRVATAVAVLLVVSFFSEMADENKVAPQRSFAHFPERIADWTGERNKITHGVVDFLRLSDYLLIDYQDRHQKTINLYVAFYESQLKGKWIHSPALCYPGNGWRFEHVQKVPLPAGGGTGKVVSVNSVMMEKDGQKQAMYYWYELRGRVITNSFWVEWYNFLDLIRKNRSDGALVRLVTPIYEAEKATDAQERLNCFAGWLLPLLEEFIPN